MLTLTSIASAADPSERAADHPERGDQVRGESGGDRMRHGETSPCGCHENATAASRATSISTAPHGRDNPVNSANVHPDSVDCAKAELPNPLADNASDFAILVASPAVDHEK